MGPYTQDDALASSTGSNFPLSCLPARQSSRLLIFPHSPREEKRAEEHLGHETKKESCKDLIRES